MTGPDAARQTTQPAPPDLEAAAADLRRSLVADTEQAQQIEQRTVQRIGEFERSQGLIAKLIVGLFVAIVVVLTGAYLLAPFSASADRITAGADKARELANTLLLPIVTLVLGYYFGKRAD